MRIEIGDVILRDMIDSDVCTYVRWFTTETDWIKKDTPWEDPIETDAESEEIVWKGMADFVKSMPENALRNKFEIEYLGKHVGFVSAYPIDQNYEPICDNIDSTEVIYTALGIEICEPDVRGLGIGTKALEGYINYLFEQGATTLYTQTWSGNLAMLRCAEKIGFVECDRQVGIREVNDEKYDAITLKLTK